MKKIVLFLFVLVMGFAIRNSFASEGKVLEGLINVNTANTEQLMLLPGIGEKKAALIIQTRAQKPFANKQDLLLVKGIGEKMIEDWKPYLSFEGTTSLKEKVVTASQPAQQTVR